MFGSEILEVAIGIIFVYLLVSVICSAVREGIEAFMKTRSAYLEHGIRELLHDSDGKGLAASFFKHPLIYGLYLDEYRPRPPVGEKGIFPWTRSRRPSYAAKGSSLPSYIPKKNFAVALMDLAARGPDTNAVTSSPESTRISLDSIRQNVQNLQNEGVQRALLTAIDTAENDIDKLQANLEAWYDSAMDRVSGWYKRSTQWIILLVGFAIAAAFNVNTVTIADALYRNESLRQAVVARAEAAAHNSNFVDSLNYKNAKAAMDSLSLPIGWQQEQLARGAVRPEKNLALFIFISLIGWLMTGLAATMGAPFWFDILNKVMVIRSTVKPAEKSKEEGSEDRQVKKGTQVTVNPAQPAGGAAGQGGGGAAPGGGGAGAGGAAPAGPPPPPPPPPPGSPDAADPGDVEADVDACSMEMDDETPDDELPQAEGGVDA
jgi:hypothetical protein